MANNFADRVTVELKSLLPKLADQNVLALINEIENPTTYTSLLSNTQQLIVFTESSNTYKQLDEQLKDSSKAPILNCANFNNAELQPDLVDVCLLIKSFNRLSVEEQQKILKKILTTLKVNGQVFLYESEWTKTKDNQASNPVDLIHFFNSALLSDKGKFGFEFIFARPLRTYVEAKQESFHICYAFKKISKTDDHTTLQDFLDQQQYSRSGVLRYERIFGPGFVSTGGLDTTKDAEAESRTSLDMTRGTFFAGGFDLLRLSDQLELIPSKYSRMKLKRLISLINSLIFLLPSEMTHYLPDRYQRSNVDIDLYFRYPEFVQSLNLKSDQVVLDVGCGIGGGDIYMAKTYGCSVVGVDLSTNMVGIAYERLLELRESKLKVSFEIGDVMLHEFAENSFDVIYSRDTILHIPDKASLFGRLYGWLKPGGQLFISDYTCAPKTEWSKEYQEYVQQRRYTLLTVPEYGKVLESVSFKEVNAQDATEKFVQCLKLELTRIESMKDEFIREFSSDDYHHLVEGWHSKLERCAKGDQRWGVFHARK